MKVYEVLFHFDKIFESENPAPVNPYIKRAYINVANKIKESHANNDNISKADIDRLDITQNMKNKLHAILLKKINEYDKRELKKSHLIDDLTNIAGIGSKKAAELIGMGLSSIKQLKQKKWASHLTTGTILLLKNKPLRRIPYDYIKKLEAKFVPNKNVKIVGGFIRQKPFSKDIDIMIISDKNIISDYIEYLRSQFLEVHVYAQGDDKASLIVKSDDNFLKVDVFISPIKYQNAMLLYVIGSKRFNIKMRSIAKRKNYVLNQYGLFPLNNGIKEKNTKPVAVTSERDFFKILDIPYVKPQNR